MFDESTQVLLATIVDLQRTADYSDLTIFCGNHIHRVHKAIVCPRSHFFARACRVGQEAIKNEITLPDDDHKLVKLMIDYLYQLDYVIKEEYCNGIIVITDEELELKHTAEPESPVAQVIERFEDISAHPPDDDDDDYWRVRSKKAKARKKSKVSSWAGFPPTPSDSVSPQIKSDASSALEERELNIHAQMYALADKYGIHGLKDLARTKFAAAASNHWDCSGFPLAMQTVFTTTPDDDNGLRDVVINILGQHRALFQKVAVDTLIKEVNGLAYSLVKAAWCP